MFWVFPDIIQAVALNTSEKLTLGRMNCSTGLYHTPFTLVPGLMALKRAVTTASCTNHNLSSITYADVWLNLQWPRHYRPEDKWLWVNVCWCRWRCCYLLVELEELHRHIALKLRPGPTGKHPHSSDDHRVEDLEVQRDDRHVGEGEHRGVRHCHNLNLFILACRWNRAWWRLLHKHGENLLQHQQQRPGRSGRQEDDSGEDTSSALWFWGLPLQRKLLLTSVVS